VGIASGRGRGRRTSTGKRFQRLYHRYILPEVDGIRKAAETFESVIEQGKRLGRAWLRSGAQIHLATSLLRAGQLNRASLDRITQDLTSVSEALPADITAEIALSAGRLEEALKQSEKACSDAEEGGQMFDHVSVQELQARVLLRMGKPEDALACVDAGIKMAEEMNYLPMLWRIRAAKAQALEMLGNNEEAAHEYETAAAIIRKLADTIPDAELKQSFMSSPLVSSIIRAPDGRTGAQ